MIQPNRHLQPSKVMVVLLSLFSICLIASVDYLTVYRMGFSIFYLVPILLLNSAFGLTVGISAAVGSTVIWFCVDMASTRVYLSPFVPYWNALIRLGYFLIIVSIFYKWQHEQLSSRIDSLTRIGNRRSFYELGEIEISRSRRYKHSLSIVYLDVDNFKEINDRYGHKAGDLLLRSVAKSIRKSLRGHDVIARLGGDEFAILMPETNGAQAKQAVSRLQKILDVMRENAWPVTFSIGIATFVTLEQSLSIDDLIKEADGLMYQAKNQGKNRVVQESFLNG